MSNFLSKLKPENKINVGVSVSSTAGLEMIVVEPMTRKVVKYAQRPITYNFSSREIEDYNEFKVLLTELFNELKISPSDANVVLNLPSVYFGLTYLPTTLDDISVETALTSEVEKEYLFKKNNPIVSWQEIRSNNRTGSRYILYSAIQEEVVNIIAQIFTELGSTLIAVENTYSSLIKTLEFTGIARDFAKTPGTWNILLVSQNSYAVFSMLGYDVIEYYEDPLAIKSFNGDEVYIAIAQAASSILDKYPAEKLMIISEAGDISAEILAMQLKHPGDVLFLECNQYAQTPVMEVDFNILPHYAKNVTPEAIGAAIYRVMDFSIKMNFYHNETAKETTIINVMGMSLTKEMLYIYSVIIMAIFLALGFVGQMLIGAYANNLIAKKEATMQEVEALNKELIELQKGKEKTNIYSLVKDIDKSMVNKILYYNAIGANIPAKVWITTFYADSTGAYDIEGQTTSVDDVYLFYRNIKSQVTDSDLIVSKLSVDDKNGLIDIDSNPNAKYSFALSNSKYSPSAESVEDNKSNDKSPNNGNMEVPNLPNLPN